MNIFDKIIKEYNDFPGYIGNVPSNENEYNLLEWLENWENKPTWTEVSNAIQASLYKDNRAKEYPKIAEQLDMLWHAIDTNSLDKTSDFYTTLKAVKDQYPKP